jgi:penicillin-insensitive murein DD-endopeptidase
MAGSPTVLALLVTFVLTAGGAQAAGEWARVKTPTAGPATSIGAPSHGCIAGAKGLPLEGPGYQVVRPSRRRFFGHPALLYYLQDLGREVARAGLADLYVADLGLPRGGPMPGGHASHQTGLDVDVFFDLAAKPRLASSRREDVGSDTLVAPDNLAVDPARWRPEHARLLALAAGSDAVDRIFVHPAIKQQLCREVESERAWLHKLRPWYGHDAHFHVRLRCPTGSPACEADTEIPPGDGCDATLAWWFAEEDGRLPAWREVDPPRPRTEPAREPTPLPSACAAVLRAK